MTVVTPKCLTVVIPERKSSKCGGNSGDVGEACVVVSVVQA